MHVVHVPVNAESTEVITVQVRELDEGLVRVGRPGRQVAVQAARSLDAMLGSVRPVAERFVAQFRGLPDPPDEICLEFGVSLSAEADLVIASTGADANFSVSLTWQRVPEERTGAL